MQLAISRSSLALLSAAMIYRIAVLLVSWAADAWIVDYDTSTRVAVAAASSDRASSFDPLSTFTRWDSIFFMRTAQTGRYEFEHFHAFLPLYPFLCRWLSLPLRSLLQPVLPSLQDDLAWIQLAGLVISNIAFLMSVLVLKKLSFTLFYTQQRTKDEAEKISWVCCALYIVNPASIFMSSMYTESLFALLSMLGMYCYVNQLKYRVVSVKEQQQILIDNSWFYSTAAAVFFALSTAVRSNGFLCSGFFLYDCLRLGLFNSMKQTAWRRLKLLLWTLAQVTCIFAPYVLYQVYGYLLYCTQWGNLNLQGMDDAAQKSFLAERHPWCLKLLPHMYGYIQGRYWGVGFLKYYTVKQIPNFLLAAPIIILSFAGVIKYARSNSTHFFTLGLRLYMVKRTRANSMSELKLQQMSRVHTPAADSVAGANTMAHASPTGDNTMPLITDQFFVGNNHILVFVYYWLFITAYCMLTINIQVMTRFLASSCPVVYWYAASLFFPSGQQQQQQQHAGKKDEENKQRRYSAMSFGTRLSARLVLFYFIAYSFVGAILFSNFYPWT